VGYFGRCAIAQAFWLAQWALRRLDWFAARDTWNHARRGVQCGVSRFANIGTPVPSGPFDLPRAGKHGAFDVADDKEHDTERTTIVRSNGNGGGAAGIILVAALILIILAVLFLGGFLNREEEEELNVQINTPDVNLILPETQVPVTTIPDVQVPPDVNVNITTPPPEAPEEEFNNAETAITNSG
jgi:hypothetical protein